MTYPPLSIPGAAKIARAYARGTVQIKVSQLAVWLTHMMQAHEGDKVLLPLYREAAGWLERCLRACDADRHGRIAAPVLRRANDEIRAIDHIRIATTGPMPLNAHAWAAWFVYFHFSVADITATWEGGKAQCWDSLSDAVDELVAELLRRTPDQDAAWDNGERIYMQAMEVVGWV